MSVLSLEFELARVILIQAINQPGANMSYKNLDKIIQQSQYAA